VSSERAKSTFDTFVDPAEIDRVFNLWSNVLSGQPQSMGPPPVS